MTNEKQTNDGNERGHLKFFFAGMGAAIIGGSLALGMAYLDARMGADARAKAAAAQAVNTRTEADHERLRASHYTTQRNMGEYLATFKVFDEEFAEFVDVNNDHHLAPGEITSAFSRCGYETGRPSGEVLLRNAPFDTAQVEAHVERTFSEDGKTVTYQPTTSFLENCLSANGKLPKKER